MGFGGTQTIDAAAIGRVFEAVRARHGAPAVHGVTRSIIVADTSGWHRTLDVDDLLAAARTRWPAEPHVAAALAWKSYAYGAMLPSTLGYAVASMVPSGGLLVRLHGHDPFVEFGLVSADVVETDLLAALRTGVFEGHLLPILEQIHERVRVGRRTLLGSVASAVCHAVARASDLVPGGAVPAAYAILDALDLADLVDFYPGAGWSAHDRPPYVLPRVRAAAAENLHRLLHSHIDSYFVSDRTSQSHTSSTCLPGIPSSRVIASFEAS